LRSIKEDISLWSKTVIEKPNKHLGNFAACPYAKSCRQKKQFKIEEVHEAKQLLPTVVDWANKLKRTKYRIAIIGCSDLSITATQLDSSIEALNFVYMPKDVYLMASHPETGDDNIDFLYDHGFNTENTFSMILIQRYQDLEEASQKLKKVGYYKYWEADYYNETVGHRHQLKERINLMRGMKKTAKKKNGKLNPALQNINKKKKKKKK
jgi:hypothetical protein